MYRTPDWIEEQLERVLVHHEASVGYSTCFWHNVLHSTPLFDRSGRGTAISGRRQRTYPKPLRRTIIAKNHPILRQTLSSYLAQIEPAVRRGDSVSIQHRVTALLAGYFDILFAVNELPHPGEKRLLQIAATRCAKTPLDMETHVNTVLETAARDPGDCWAYRCAPRQPRCVSGGRGSPPNWLIPLWISCQNRFLRLLSERGRSEETGCMVKIHARVQNSYGKHLVTLTTNDNAHPIVIAPKASGFGSSANGGELLFLALATCYCNDIYREAAKRGIEVERVEVDVDGQFGAEGEPRRT